jgi:hypothetical protein
VRLDFQIAHDASRRRGCADSSALVRAASTGARRLERLVSVCRVIDEIAADHPRTVMGMSQYMAWPTADGVWHIGTGLTLPFGASLADLNKLLTLHHIDRAQIGFHRPNDEVRFNEQFAIESLAD